MVSVCWTGSVQWVPKGFGARLMRVVRVKNTMILESFIELKEIGFVMMNNLFHIKTYKSRFVWNNLTF